MSEVVTDNLEASFEALEREHLEVEGLREEVAALKARLSASERPLLSGAKSEGWPSWSAICAGAWSMASN